MHSSGTKDSGFRAFAETLMPTASSSHATDNNSCLLQSYVKREPTTTSEMKTSMPLKQLWGSDDEYPTGISVILFEKVNDDDGQSQGNDDDVDLMILGQGPAITMDAVLEPEQVSKTHQYQWHNNSPWVKEARNALLSQDPWDLSNVRWDCTAIMVMILEEAKNKDILQVELEASSSKPSMPCGNWHGIRASTSSGSSQTGMHHPAQAWGFRGFMSQPHRGTGTPRMMASQNHSVPGAQSMMGTLPWWSTTSDWNITSC